MRGTVLGCTGGLLRENLEMTRKATKVSEQSFAVVFFVALAAETAWAIYQSWGQNWVWPVYRTVVAIWITTVGFAILSFVERSADALTLFQFVRPIALWLTVAMALSTVLFFPPFPYIIIPCGLSVGIWRGVLNHRKQHGG
jgi:hypothetical protein